MRRIAAILASMLAMVAWAGDSRHSGYDYMTPSLQAMQDDPAANPAELAVQDGAALWQEGQNACQSCHDLAAMRGVAARYPAYDSRSQRAVTLLQRIRLCRVNYQHQPDWPPESAKLLALAAFIGKQSFGQMIESVSDPRLQPVLAAGEALFRRRAGQLDLSCADCHDDHAGQSLGGATIPEAHPTGYPIYRLEWQSVVSLPRRLKNCLSGMRAVVPASDSPELVALELFLRQRAAGMKVETPSVRP